MLLRKKNGPFNQMTYMKISLTLTVAFCTVSIMQIRSGAIFSSVLWDGIGTGSSPVLVTLWAASRPVGPRRPATVRT